MTAGDISTFFDQRAPREMAKSDVAGAAIVVVKDGKVLFARGSGLGVAVALAGQFSDLEWALLTGG